MKIKSINTHKKRGKCCDAPWREREREGEGEREREREGETGWRGGRMGEGRRER